MSQRLRLIAGGALAAALAVAATPGWAHHFPLIVQLNMPLQAAVAGYFVADYQGFYEEAEIGVSLLPGGPGIEPAAMLGKDGINLIVERMPQALAAREAGAPLVNIGQAFPHGALELVCSVESGIKAPADMRGHKVGVWTDGNRYAVLAWLAAAGLKSDELTLIDQGHDASLLLNRQADCISAMSYDEQAQLVDAGIPPDSLSILRFEDHAPAPLEDGFWVEQRQLADPDMVWTFASFLYATQRGWEWARQHPVEAVRIVQEYAPPRSIEEKPQVRRMQEVNRLTEGGTAILDPTAFAGTVALLLGAGAERAITRQPDGAWSHAAVDQAGLADSGQN